MDYKRFAQEFEDKCRDVNSHGFLGFITKKRENNNSYLDLLSQVEKTIEFLPVNHDRNIELDEQKISDLMLEFFSKCMPKKVDEVKQILNKTHTYFLDADGVSHVNFIETKAGDPRSSSVGHRDRNSFLDFNVFIHGSIDDLRTTAHEITHALSSHHQFLIKMIRNNSSEEEINNYIHKGFESDCLGEIESHIIERIFNRFLVKKGIYTEKDLENYDNEQKNCLLSEIRLIKEEQCVIKNLPQPVTYESLAAFVKDLQKADNIKLLNRIKEMHDESKSSFYMFRYVVGRIVADQWIKTFDKAGNQEERSEMLNHFQEFLDKTHELDLENACEFLLNKNFNHITNDFIKDRQNVKKFDDKDQ